MRIIAPVLGASGYASDGRSLFLALERDPRFEVQLAPLRFGSAACREDEGFLRSVLAASERELPVEYDALHVVFPPQFRPDPKARRNILRTMYETDGVPESWIPSLRLADELWVPSAFHLRSFGAALPGTPIRIVPEILDPLFSSGMSSGASSARSPGAGPTRFLSVFDWSTRKNPEALLSSFGSEFARGEAELTLKISNSAGVAQATLRTQAVEIVARAARAAGHEAPALRFVEEGLAADEMPGLYEAADAFVLATRGEGWCRPVHEAMACGIPVVTSAFGGIQELVGEAGTSLVVAGRVTPVSAAAIRENPALASAGSQQAWLEIDREDLCRQMRFVRDEPAEAATIVARGRDHVLRHFTRLPDLATPVSAFGETCGERVVTRFEGQLLGYSSYSRITRAVAHELIERHRDVELQLVETNASPAARTSRDELSAMLAPKLLARVAASAATAGERSDVCIRSGWPVSARPPNARRWVQRVDWEYGSLPKELATTLSHGPDEIWVHSRFVRETLVAGGIARDRIQLMPHGIDPASYHPNRRGLPELREWTGERHAFLFVGPTIPRKGFDLLLGAWMRAFRREDPVCLLVQSADTRRPYHGQGCAEVLERVRTHPHTAEIRVLSDEVDDAAMPELYASCDCLVHPYRGEGFGMTLLEARACGLAIVTTKGGAPDDFLTDTGCIRLPARRVAASVDAPCVTKPYLLEVEVDALVDALRRAVDERSQLRAEARQDAERIRSAFSWRAAAQRVRDRLQHLRS